jgi:tight adherence protein B
VRLLAPIFAALSVLLLAIWFYQRERSRAHMAAQLSRRLQSLARETPEEHVHEPESLLHDKRHSDIQYLNDLLTHLRRTSDLERLVRHAGLKLRAGQVVLWMGLFGTGAGMLGFAFYDNVVVAAACFLVGGPGTVLGCLKRRRKTRRHLLATQLPDTLDMIRSSLQAGHSFNHALEMIAEEGPEPLAGEFRQVLDELRLGHPVKAAMQGLYDRTGLSDLRFFVVAVMLNRELGGSLSDIIEVVSRTIRERFKLKGQVQALTAQGRFSAIVLVLMSPMLMFAISTLNPDYMDPLFHTPIGHTMLAYSALSTVFGYYLMRKIVDVKVIQVD